MRNGFGGNKEAAATTFGDLKIVSIDTLEGTTSITVIGGQIVLIVEYELEQIKLFNKNRRNVSTIVPMSVTIWE
jgi:hypothetical protein